MRLDPFGLGSSRSVSCMVRMTLENCKCTIELFQQNHAGEFMRQSHLAQRELELRGVSGFRGESVCSADSEQKLLRAACLVVVNKLREFFRRELLPAGIKQNQHGRGARRGFVHLLEERGFAGEFLGFNRDVP